MIILQNTREKCKTFGISGQVGASQVGKTILNLTLMHATATGLMMRMIPWAPAHASNACPVTSSYDQAHV